MPYDVQFCDEHGKTMLGSDGVTYIDRRKSTPNALKEIAEHRERFRENFFHKYEQMSHCILRGRIYKVPSLHNFRPMNP